MDRDATAAARASSPALPQSSSMVASFQLADVGRAKALGRMYEKLSTDAIPGLRFGMVGNGTRLGGNILTAPRFGRVGVLAFWDDDSSYERYLRDHPLARDLEHGFHTRLLPARGAGSWPELPELGEYRI